MSQPLYQPSAYPPAAPSRHQPRPRKWVWIAGIVIAFLAGTGVGVVIAPSQAPASSPTNTPQAPAAHNPTPAAPAALPKPADFTIDIKVLKKECFGSAGCNITYRIDPTYTGATPLPSDRQITVVYEITGGDQPQINRFTLNGRTATYPNEQLIQTASSDSQLKAKATDVL